MELTTMILLLIVVSVILFVSLLSLYMVLRKNKSKEEIKAPINEGDNTIKPFKNRRKDFRVNVKKLMELLSF